MAGPSITIRYFAAIREMVDRETEQLDPGMFADGEDHPTVGRIWEELVERHPDLEGLQDHLRFAVDREFVDLDHPVEAGAEVALIPPVSGGAGTDGKHTTDGGRYVITREPLELEEVRQEVVRPEAGAVVTFEGVVRDHTGDRDVEALEYECYAEMALEKLVETADRAHDQWETVEAAIHHRYGHLEVGDSAVAIAVASPHRGPAFEASEFIIDRLKEVVPIWKKEIGPGGETWVGWGA